jgi:DNA-directed RNA polymerase subunit beta
MGGRSRIYEAIVKGKNAAAPGVPESFNVLVQELRGLALDVRIYDKKEREISLSEWSDEGTMSRRKSIKVDRLNNEYIPAGLPVRPQITRRRSGNDERF